MRIEFYLRGLKIFCELIELISGTSGGVPDSPGTRHSEIPGEAGSPNP